MNKVECGNMYPFMKNLADESVMLLWTDPPFGTGDPQTLASTGMSYQDMTVQDTINLCQLMATMCEWKLHPRGTLAICLDHRAVHDVQCAVREGELHFAGEIIWHSELGGTSKSWWTNKHNTILLFTKGHPKFNAAAVPLAVRRAPRGDYTSVERPVNSVWNVTLGSSSKERVGYPNQKPEAIVEPFVAVHTDPGDLVVDPFCGSGTVGAVAERLGRRWLLNDSNPEAVALAEKRIYGL